MRTILYASLALMVFSSCHPQEQGLLLRAGTFKDTTNYDMEFLSALHGKKVDSAKARPLPLPMFLHPKPLAYGRHYFHGAAKVNGGRRPLLYVIADYEKDSCFFIMDVNGNEDLRDDCVQRIVCGKRFTVALQNQQVKKTWQHLELIYKNNMKPKPGNEAGLKTFYEYVMRGAPHRLPSNFALYVKADSKG